MRPLHDVCDIQIGFTARTKLEPSHHGVLALQQSDIVDDRTMPPRHLTRVRITSPIDRYLVRAGDVVFRTRGDRTIAVALGDGFEEPAVAVSPLMALHPDPKAILAEYLAWAMNQQDAQQHFDAAARGTSIRMVPKASLDSLCIDVPDLETQRRIVAVDGLAAREAALVNLLSEKKRELTNRLLAERAKRPPQINSQERTAP